MDLKINIFNIIILMGILQGVVFSLVVLLSKKYSSRTNSYLAYTVISLIVSNLQYWFIDTRLSHSLPFLSYLRIPSELLILPMFYLFVRHYLEKKCSKNLQLIIFSPFLIDFLVQSLLAINDCTFKLKVNELYYYLEELFSFGFSLLLIIKTFQLIIQYEKENKKFNYSKVTAQTKWIKQLLLLGFFACIFWVFVLVYMKAYDDVSIYYCLWISISFIVYWISYVGLFQSSLFTERKVFRNELISNKSELIFEPITKKKITDESNQKLIADFESITNQLFTNPNLRLEDVAQEMGISSNYLSQVLSANAIRFNHYVNEIRVEKVKKLLTSESFSQYTITSIGLEAGFNSNASFYRSFKRITGVSPIVYRNTNL